MDDDTQGARIRALFESAEGEIAVIAPFIKVDALRSLLQVIPAGPHLRCVSRWLPREIAAGVSDPEILDLLETRGNFSLSLVDRLHAKLYIAGDRCLAGSANVTLAGLGERGDGSNIEILVETTIDESGIAATLEAISRAERPATRSMAQTARRLADSLASSTASAVALNAPWFPGSRRPEQAYRYYAQPPSGFVGLPITYFSLTWQAPTSHRALKRASFRPRFGPCLPPYHSPRPFLKRPKTRHLPEPTRIPGLRRSPGKTSPPTTCGSHSSTGWRIFSPIGS